MFGYITANRKQLSPGELEVYRGCYCGLCHALRQRYGNRARLALSFDLTFVTLLLTALYDQEPGRVQQHHCPFHPLRTLPRRENRFMEYGADMSVLLRYYQYLDHWQDEGDRRSRCLADRLEPAIQALAVAWPRQVRQTAQAVAALTQAEQAGETDLDQVAGCTGRMLAEILVFREDEWSPYLRRIGFFLGKFIYTMDAYEDLEQDRKRGRYNPLLDKADQPDFQDRCGEYLTDLMAQATLAFERLPILDEEASTAGLLRNVLYSGVWTRYDWLRHKQEKERRMK